MVDAHLELINGSKLSDKTFNVVYLPYCISTLKLLLTNNENESIAVTITPKESRNDEELCCDYDDDKKGIKISWGGGNEDDGRRHTCA
jgi:hypothetical protein